MSNRYILKNAGMEDCIGFYLYVRDSFMFIDPDISVYYRDMSEYAAGNGLTLEEIYYEFKSNK